MGGSCGTYERKEKCILGFRGDTWGNEAGWKIQESRGRTILKRMLKKQMEGRRLD